MQFGGERVKRTRWIHAGPCVVQVEVEAVIPIDDPTEPCYEPATVQWLSEVRRRAEAGDIDWLNRIGRVYMPVAA